MAAPEILDEVQARGVTLVVDSNNLRCKGDKAALTSGLITVLKEHKSKILSLMKCGRCHAPLSGPINKQWRVLDGSEATYLCFAECVFWTFFRELEEVPHDSRY
jgi:hypothetical protein